LAIVYHRRIGKSTLIRNAIKHRAHVFYQAVRVTSSLNSNHSRRKSAIDSALMTFWQASVQLAACTPPANSVNDRKQSDEIDGRFGGFVWT
jgi:AAA+ ATPase superfamily predicted ATPase